ncbi:hypothetical protein GIB67_040400 [Kingdonia uniflora]|uniref:START domain-containing protein n=1 Tax=Kingdonia uniflora TaxID=39325 RepID=A0A7J7KXI8_9MAGN|nr:hypothetical protein GIB67_040400 [Kingdonia uniflora]
MDKKLKILEYRELLDKTLASHHLGNKETIKTLIKKQLLRSPPSDINGSIEDVLERRSTEISNILEYFRSASENNRHRTWKVPACSRRTMVSKMSLDEEAESSVSYFFPRLIDVDSKIWRSTCFVVSRYVAYALVASVIRATHGSGRVQVRDFPKLKEDSDRYRVMYREGPQGTPFHTLLVEGYADAPIDVCLCASWEARLYRKWWPTFSIPTFKVIAANSLEKVRIGEEISLVRMKVPWPLHNREVVLNYFELECFEDDLIIVLLNSISEKEAHGFSNYVTPESKDTVRMDLVGGFVMKKITSKISYYRCGLFVNKYPAEIVGCIELINQVLTIESSENHFAYFGFDSAGSFSVPRRNPVFPRPPANNFTDCAIEHNSSHLIAVRTVANMDIKLDFVPPYLINFIARQLIAGAAKLFNKTVASVAKGDEGFGIALEDLMYLHLRENLYSSKKLCEAPEAVVPKTEKFTVLPEALEANKLVLGKKSVGESTETEIGHDLDATVSVGIGSSNKDNRYYASPKVEFSLGTLKNGINMVRGGGSGITTCSQDRDI